MKVFAQILIALKVGFKSVFKLIFVVRSFGQHMLYRDKAVCRNAYTVDKTAAAVILCALALCVTYVDSIFKTAHKAGEEGDAQMGNCF